jgi:hypothetical protein
LMRQLYSLCLQFLILIVQENFDKEIIRKTMELLN